MTWLELLRSHRRYLALAVGAVSVAGASACASASMSRESVWVCRRPDCGESDMVRSGRDEWMGETKVHLVTVRGLLAVNFDLEEDHAVGKAALTDCKGTSVAIPGDQLKGPGTHGVEDGTGWAVFVTPREMSPLDQSCGLMVLSVQEQRGDKTWDHSFSLSHHPKIGWVSAGELGDYDDLWPPR